MNQIQFTIGAIVVGVGLIIIGSTMWLGIPGLLISTGLTLIWLVTP